MIEGISITFMTLLWMHVWLNMSVHTEDFDLKLQEKVVKICYLCQCTGRAWGETECRVRFGCIQCRHGGVREFFSCIHLYLCVWRVLILQCMFLNLRVMRVFWLYLDAVECVTLGILGYIYWIYLQYCMCSYIVFNVETHNSLILVLSFCSTYGHRAVCDGRVSVDVLCCSAAPPHPGAPVFSRSPCLSGALPLSERSAKLFLRWPFPGPTTCSIHCHWTRSISQPPEVHYPLMAKLGA